jgi:hypothetical protein
MGRDTRHSTITMEHATKLRAIRTGLAPVNRATHGDQCRSRRLRACLRTLALVGVGAALLFGSLPGAQAQTPQPETPQAPGDCAEVDGPCCALGAGNPKYEVGQVWGQGRLDCNFQAETMSITVRLFRDGIQRESQSYGRTRVSSIIWTVAVPCGSGSARWQTRVRAVVDSPQDGNQQEWQMNSQIRTIGCSQPPPSTTTTTSPSPSTTTTTRPCANPPRCHVP